MSRTAQIRLNFHIAQTANMAGFFLVAWLTFKISLFKDLWICDLYLMKQMKAGSRETINLRLCSKNDKFLISYGKSTQLWGNSRWSLKVTRDQLDD